MQQVRLILSGDLAPIILRVELVVEGLHGTLEDSCRLSRLAVYLLILSCGKRPNTARISPSINELLQLLNKVLIMIPRSLNASYGLP